MYGILDTMGMYVGTLSVKMLERTMLMDRTLLQRLWARRGYVWRHAIRVEQKDEENRMIIFGSLIKEAF